MGSRLGLSIIRRRETCLRTGLSKSSLYRLISEGKFPEPVQISDRRVGWVSSEVENWIETKIAARDERAAHRVGG